MADLVIASGNPGKMMELRALLQHLPITLINPHDLSLFLQVEEQNDSYLANATRKAQAYAKESGLWALGDDTGLEVDALQGAPGLRSARLAGPGRTDSDRRELLLSLLQSHPIPWTARFRSVIVLSSPSGDVDFAEGICEGQITQHARGEKGFGYDPIFLLKDRDVTMAELSMEEKNHLSHRARAVQSILPVMKKRMEID